MKPLKHCYHHPDRPVQPPSLVLCKECLDGIGDTLQKMCDEFKTAKEDLKCQTSI